MLILFLIFEITYFSINIIYYQFYYFTNSENNLNKWLQGASEWIMFIPETSLHHLITITERYVGRFLLKDHHLIDG